MPKFTTFSEFEAQAALIMTNISDQAVISTNISDIKEGVADILQRNKELTEQNAQLAAGNEKLRAANMELFYKVGSPQKSEPQIDKQELDEPKIKFDDIFKGDK